MYRNARTLTGRKLDYVIVWINARCLTLRVLLAYSCILLLNKEVKFGSMSQAAKPRVGKNNLVHSFGEILYETAQFASAEIEEWMNSNM